MTIHTTFPPGPRLAAFERMIDAFERDEIEAAVDALIARLDAADGDPDTEDDERGGEMMIAPGVDYDPAMDDATPDGLAGVPEDAEDDDPAGTHLDRGEGAAWIETAEGGQTTVNGRNDSEDDEPSSLSLAREYRSRVRRRACDWTDMSGARKLGWYRHTLRPRARPCFILAVDL